MCVCRSTSYFGPPINQPTDPPTNSVIPVSRLISSASLSTAERKVLLSASRRGESSAFLLNPWLVKSTCFIEEAGSTVATLRTGAPYYLLIEKARAIRMPHVCACTLAACKWIIMNAICALKEPSAPRPLQRGAGSQLTLVLFTNIPRAELVYVVGVRTASANSTIFICLLFFNMHARRPSLGARRCCCTCICIALAIAVRKPRIKQDSR